MNQRFQVFRRVAKLAAAIEQIDRLVPPPRVEQGLDLGIRIGQFAQRRNGVHRPAGELNEPRGQLPHVLVGKAEQVADQRACFGLLDVLGAEQELVVRRPLRVPRPERGIDGQRP